MCCKARSRRKCLCRQERNVVPGCPARRHRLKKISLAEHTALPWARLGLFFLVTFFLLSLEALTQVGYAPLSCILVCLAAKTLLLDLFAAGFFLWYFEACIPREAGFCYLRLFPPADRLKAANELGAFPLLADLARFLPDGLRVVGKPGAVWHFPGTTVQSVWRFASSRGRAGYDDPLLSMFRTLEGTIHAEAMTSDMVQRHLKNMDHTLKYSEYTLSDREADLLAAQGLQVTRVPGMNHRHAAAKRIEDHFLHMVLPPHFGSRNTIMFQKSEKTRKWFTLPGKHVELFNPTLTARDVGRYRQAYLPSMPKSLDSDFLFMHDAGHYLSFADVAMLFSRYDSLQKIAFTAILPAEATERAPSLFPELYGLHYHQNSYSFTLKGMDEDAYEHPYHSLDWLKCGEVTSSSGLARHTVERIETVYAHHLFVVTRGRAPVRESYRGFPVPKAYELPATNRFMPRYQTWVPRTLYDNSVRHLRHLKTSSYENAMAKIRQEIKGAHPWVTNQAYDLCAENLTKLATVRIESESVDPTVWESLWFKYNALSHNLLFQVLAALFLGATLEILHCVYGFGFTTLPVGVRSTERLHPGDFVALILYATAWLIWLLYFWRVLLAWLSGSLLIVFGLLYALNHALHLGIGHLPQDYVPVGPQVSLAIHGFASTRVVHPEVITAFLVLWPLLFQHVVQTTKCYFGSREVRQKRLTSHLDPKELHIGWKVAPFGTDLRNLNPWVRKVGPGEVEDLSNYEQVPEPEEPVLLSPIAPSFGELERLHLRHCRDCPQHPADAGAVCVAGFPIRGPDPCHHCAEYYQEFREAPAKTLGEAQYTYEMADDTATGDYVAIDAIGPHPETMRFRTRSPGSPVNPVPVTCGVTALSLAFGHPVSHVQAVISKLPNSAYSSPITVRQLDVRSLVWYAISTGRSTKITTGAGDWLVGDPDDSDVVLAHDGTHFVSLVPPPAPEATPRSRAIAKAIADALMSTGSAIRKGRRHWEFKYVDEAPHTVTAMFQSNYQSFLRKAGIVAPKLHYVKYIPNPHRAKFLARDQKNNHAGKIYSMQGKGDVPRSYCRQLDALVSKFCQHDNRPAVDVAVVYGMPGCGKSHPLQRWIAKTNIPYKVACPTVENRTDWSSLVAEPDKWRTGTYETNLFKTASTLIIDEISQMPPGYVDLAIIADPTIRNVIIMGDHCQGMRYERDPEATSRELSHEVDYFLPALREYHCYTYRLFKALANLLCVYTANPAEGFIKRVNLPPPDIPVVSAMRRDVDMMSDMGVKAFSAVTVQGKSFKTPVAIDFNLSMASKVPKGSAHACLTRSKAGVYIAGTGSNAYNSALKDPLWAAVLQGWPRPYEQIFSDRFEGLKVRMLRKPYTSWVPTNLSPSNPGVRLASQSVPSSTQPESGRAGQVFLPAPASTFATPALAPAEAASPIVNPAVGSTGVFDSSFDVTSGASDLARGDLDRQSRSVFLPSSGVWQPSAHSRALPKLASEPASVAVEVPSNDFRFTLPTSMPRAQVVNAEVHRHHLELPHPVVYSAQGANSGCDLGIMTCGCWSVPSVAGCLAFDEEGAQTHARRHSGKPSVGVWKPKRRANLRNLRFGARSYGDAPIDLRLGFSEVGNAPVASHAPVEIPAPEVPPTVHMLPVSSAFESLLVDKHGGDKDVVYRGESTQQFLSAKEKVVSAESMAPRHQPARDPSLWRMTIDKRLRFADAHRNFADLTSRGYLGRALYLAFHSVRGTDPYAVAEFNFDEYALCIEENDLNKLSKGTQALLLNNAFKSDADWRFTFVRIFIKTQHKISATTLGSLPKAGQSIANFNDRVLLYYGPMVRYLGKSDDAVRPSCHYYHAGKSTVDLDRWCKDWVPVGGEHLENDFTAFDQSQTGEALEFELLRLSQASIPPDIIDSYRNDKLGLTCQLGSLQTMRFSGEPGTWRFNTDFNYALSGLRYGLKPKDVMMMSGDDSLIFRARPDSPVWKKLGSHFTVVAKRSIVARGTFCSYIITPFGCIKEPMALAAKLMVALEQDRLSEVSYSLLSEHAVTYQKGDFLTAVLTSDELEAVQYANVVFKKCTGSNSFLSKIRTGTYASYIDSFVIRLREGAAAQSLLLGYYRLFTRADQLRFKNLLSSLGIGVY